MGVAAAIINNAAELLYAEVFRLSHLRDPEAHDCQNLILSSLSKRKAYFFGKIFIISFFIIIIIIIIITIRTFV